MRTIAVIARKGGAGKTTVATQLALAAHLRGYVTLLADIDPQRSSTQVMAARAGAGPDCADTSGSRLAALQMSAALDAARFSGEAAAEAPARATPPRPEATPAAPDWPAAPRL